MATEIQYLNILRRVHGDDGTESLELKAYGRVTTHERWWSVELWIPPFKKCRKDPPSQTSLAIVATLIAQTCAGDRIGRGPWVIRRSREPHHTPYQTLVHLNWYRQETSSS